MMYKNITVKALNHDKYNLIQKTPYSTILELQINNKCEGYVDITDLKKISYKIEELGL